MLFWSIVLRTTFRYSQRSWPPLPCPFRRLPTRHTQQTHNTQNTTQINPQTHLGSINFHSPFPCSFASFHAPLDPCLVHQSFAGAPWLAKKWWSMCGVLFHLLWLLNTPRIHRFAPPISMLFWSLDLRINFRCSQRSWPLFHALSDLLRHNTQQTHTRHYTQNTTHNKQRHTQ